MRRRKKAISKELLEDIKRAERASYIAYNMAIAENAPFFLRACLGSVQSRLMHYVVKHAK